MARERLSLEALTKVVLWVFQRLKDAGLSSSAGNGKIATRSWTGSDGIFDALGRARGNLKPGAFNTTELQGWKGKGASKAELRSIGTPWPVDQLSFAVSRPKSAYPHRWFLWRLVLRFLIPKMANEASSA